MNRILTFLSVVILSTSTLWAQSIYPEKMPPTSPISYNSGNPYPKPFLKKQAFASQDSDNAFSFSISNNNGLIITVSKKESKICDQYFNLESPSQTTSDPMLGREIVPAERTFAFNYSRIAPNYPTMLVSSFYLDVDASHCVTRYWTNNYLNLKTAIQYLEDQSQASAIAGKMLQLFEDVQSKIPDDIAEIIYQARQ